MPELHKTVKTDYADITTSPSMAPSVLGSSSTAGGWVTTVRWRVRLRLSTTVLTSHLHTRGI